MEGRRYSDGLRKRLKAKKVFQFEEAKTSASITYQTSSVCTKRSCQGWRDRRIREIYNIRVIQFQPTVDYLYWPSVASAKLEIKNKAV